MAQKLYAVPSNNDVLCGRGLKNFKHAGNQALRHKIIAELDRYLECTRRSDKTAIIRGVVHEIMQEGGRFLKFDFGAKVWFDGGIAAARKRVGVAFRDATDPTKVTFIANLKRDAAAAQEAASTDSSRSADHNSGEGKQVFANMSLAAPCPVPMPLPGIARTNPTVNCQATTAALQQSAWLFDTDPQFWANALERSSNPVTDDQMVSCIGPHGQQIYRKQQLQCFYNPNGESSIDFVSRSSTNNTPHQQQQNNVDMSPITNSPAINEREESISQDFPLPAPGDESIFSDSFLNDIDGIDVRSWEYLVNDDDKINRTSASNNLFL